MDAIQQETIAAIARTLRHCRSILFITGAGISADSGVPTYRGIGGMYDVGETDEGLPIEEILSGSMLQTNPQLTWKYLGQIAHAARGATFNRGHAIIAQFEQCMPRVWTLTQNVDGFHRLAGSRNVIEIHGNMRSLSCLKCEYHLQVDEHTELDIPPLCPACASILRPDVVLFEEFLPDEALIILRRELEIGFGAVFSIGTSSLFPYIQEPMLLAKRQRTPTIEINPGETSVSGFADYRLNLGATAALEAIWQGYQQMT